MPMHRCLCLHENMTAFVCVCICAYFHGERRKITTSKTNGNIKYNICNWNLKELMTFVKQI